MDNKTLKDRFGMNGVTLAALTGQNANTISRKLRGDQGLSLGAREAGALSLWSNMTDEQREKALSDLPALTKSLAD